MGDLRLRNVTKDYGQFLAVNDVSLSFPQGQLTALLGPSGCGKTTILRMIAGLERPTRGRILLGDADVTDAPAHARRFGMVFQSFALFPHLSVAENVAYSLAISGVGKPDRRARAEALLDLVKLSGLGDRRIGALSGGQRQRVAIARALAQKPSVFLLDEPMSALDANLREEMQVELRLLQQKLGITTIVVTHDQREAMTMADQIIVMSQGVAEQVGPPQEVYSHPASAFVAGFIGKANFLDGVIDAGAVQTLGQTLHPAKPAAFRAGSAVTVACRPEAVRLTRAARADANQIPVRVSFVRDIGPNREIHLDAGAVRMTAELGHTDRETFAVGDAIFAELPASALRLFPRGAP